MAVAGVNWRPPRISRTLGDLRGFTASTSLKPRQQDADLLHVPVEGCCTRVTGGMLVRIGVARVRVRTLNAVERGRHRFQLVGVKRVTDVASELPELLRSVKRPE